VLSEAIRAIKPASQDSRLHGKNFEENEVSMETLARRKIAVGTHVIALGRKK